MARSRRNHPGRLDPFRLAGSKLGRYTLVELIGAGGMGAVYHARHNLNPEVKVALKILKPDLAYSHRGMADDFLEEARRTSRLDHPGIIRVLYFDFDEQQQLPFFVMEWLDGRTLEQELEASGRMSPARVTELLDKVSRAISYAHEQGLIHRDLKPGNIMLVKDGRGREVVKVLDFGIAKAIDSKSSATISRVMGAPYYASPEQLNVGGKIDRRSDIYSLGVTVYQLLTGVLPFDSDSISVVINQHLSQTPPPMRSILPEIPAGIERVVKRALMKRPQDRYADVSEFAHAFRQASGMETGSLVLSVADAQTRRGVASASVYLDGSYVGSTDAGGQFRADDLDPHEYLLRIEAYRYAQREEAVSVSPNGEGKIDWELEPQSTGDLTLKTNVARAEVFVNGELKGHSDASGGLHLRDVTPGSLAVEVRRRKYKPFAGEVRVQPGKAAALEVELEKSPRRRLPVYLLGALVLACVVAGAAYLLIPGEDDEEEAFSSSVSGAAWRRRAEELASNGAVHLKSRNFEAAEAAFREATNLNPTNADYYRLLGEALLNQQPRKALRKQQETHEETKRLEKLEEIKRAFRAGVLLKPNDAEYRYRLGETFFNAGQFRWAEDEYQKAIDLAPERAEFHVRKGELYEGWWKYRQAVAEYSAALGMWPAEDAGGMEAVRAKYESARRTAGEYPYTEEAELADAPFWLEEKKQE